MFSFSRWRMCATLVVFGSHLAAQPALTTIQDVLYTADGNRFDGSVTITWKTFEATDSSNIASSITRVQVDNGILFVELVPTTSANPSAGYAVEYSGTHRTQFSETWIVPPSATPLRVRDVRLPPGAVSTPGPPAATTVQISDVVGLQSALNLRPTAGTGFGVARAAVINSVGSLDGAVGNLSDCIHVDGTAGPCGDASSPNSTGFVDAEIPSGIQDGTNPTFTLTNAPNPSSSLTVYRNGLRLRQSGDFTISGSTITFLAGAVPQAPDAILTSYRVGVTLPGVAFVDGEVPSGVINGVNTLFTITQSPSPAASLAVYRNGLRLKSGLDYTFTGTSITFAGADVPQTSDVLLCSYRVAQ